MKSIKIFVIIGFILNLVIFSQNLLAQDIDTGFSKLSAEDEKRYREILDRPVDPGWLNIKKILLYKEKRVAAEMLGDRQGVEENLREWAQIDIDGKWNLRSYLSSMGRFEESVKVGYEVIDYERFPPAAARIRSYVALDYLNINDVKKAEELMRSAEEIMRYGMGSIRLNARSSANIARAETEVNTARSILLMRQGKWEEARVLGNLAVEKSKSMLKLVDSVQDEPVWKFSARNSAFQALGNVINQQIAMGQLVSAEWQLRDALKLAKENNFNQNQMINFNIMTGDILNGSARYEQSLKYLADAQRQHIEQGFPKSTLRWMRIKSKELSALAGTNQWERAYKSLEEATLDTKGTPYEPRNTIDPKLIGLIQIKNNKFDEAISVLSVSYQSNLKNYGNNHYYTAISQGLLGVAYWKKGDLTNARNNLEQARLAINSPESLSGDFSENAIQRKTNRFIFESYMQMLAQSAQSSPKDAETLFLLSDQVNSSSVQQALSEAAVRSGVNIPGLADVIRKEQDAKNEMASLVTYITNQNSQQEGKQNPQVVQQMRQRLHDLEVLRKEYKAAIQKGFPEYFQLIQPRAPSPQEIAKLLSDDELFVSILPMASESYVWAINKNGEVKFHRSDWGEQTTNKTVDDIRKTLDVAGFGNKIPKFDYAKSLLIYKAFFEPFSDMMQGKRHMVVATSGSLAKLPFAILQTRTFAGQDPADAPWLINNMAVSHVPTASGWMSLKRFGRVPASKEPLIAWGDPLFDRLSEQKVAAVESTKNAATVRSIINTRSANKLETSDDQAYLNYNKIPPLPETWDEIQELAQILGANPSTDLILGKNATRTSVLKSSSSGELGKKQIVVFATHGLLSGDLPNLTQPALAMAANLNPSESPLLTLEDVLSLKLNADWVVLSACNTAGADGKAEEAMSGLARGFFFAGSRSLLVTHWSVESESAMQLTTHTFSNYKKDPSMRRSEALRQSMLSVMKSPQFSHPAFWAPYALVGEGGR